MAQGAVLQPSEMGEIKNLDPGIKGINVGKITWEPIACLTNPMFVMLSNSHFDSRGRQTTNLPINSGFPF